MSEPKGSRANPLSLLDLPFTVPGDGFYWLTYGTSEPMQLPWSPEGSVLDVERQFAAGTATSCSSASAAPARRSSLPRRPAVAPT